MEVSYETSGELIITLYGDLKTAFVFLLYHITLYSTGVQITVSEIVKIQKEAEVAVSGSAERS